MTAQFTPGPWLMLADPYEDGTPYFRIAARPSKDASDSYYDDETCHGFRASAIMSEANARLIAAAPEMYEALCEVIEFLRDPDIPFPPALHDKITNALHKAEGKQP